MIKNLKNEVWKEIKFGKGVQLRYKYAVSSQGRMASYSKEITDGDVLKGATIQGYSSLNLRPNGESFTRYVHKLVAGFFVPRKSNKQKFVIHLDYNKRNNIAKNLKWATQDEVNDHYRRNPALKTIGSRIRYSKLTESKVLKIKEMINADRTTVKDIAARFEITPMQIFRIKRGENWSHVKVQKKK
jgi:hypothetical protein